MACTRLFAMIATSAITMLGLVYLNTYAMGQEFVSKTRMWMAPGMGAAMAISMLAFIPGMHSDRRLNIAIFADIRANGDAPPGNGKKKSGFTVNLGLSRTT